MNSENNNYIHNGSQSESNSDKPNCTICGQQFDDMAKMQRHMMVQHMNENDFPEVEADNK
jgi:stress-induced morphogen